MIIVSMLSRCGHACAELALGLAGAPSLTTLTLAGCDVQAGFLAEFV